METHSSILSWRIPWTDEPPRSHRRVRHDLQWPNSKQATKWRTLASSPGERHGNPLQYSCLENPMDRGAWRATIHGVAKSRTRLKRLSMHASALGKQGPRGSCSMQNQTNMHGGVNRCFQTVVLQKRPESLLDSKIRSVNPKGNQPWIFTARTDAEAPILQPPDAKSQLTEKRLWGWERVKAEGNDRGWEDWVVSPTYWTLSWANSGRYW